MIPEIVLSIKTDAFHNNQVGSFRGQYFHPNVYNSLGLTKLLENSLPKINQAKVEIEIRVAEKEKEFNISKLLEDISSRSPTFNITEISLSVDELDENIASGLKEIQTLTRLTLNYLAPKRAALISITEWSSLNTLNLYKHPRQQQTLYSTSLVELNLPSWNKNLKNVGLSFENLSNETFLSILSTPIKELNLLINTPVDHTMWVESIDKIAKNLHLRKIIITLRPTGKFSPENAIVLGPLFRSQHIRHLELHGFDSHIFSNENLCSLELTNLESLFVPFLNIATPNEVKNLLEALAKSNTIRHLKLPIVLADELLLIAKLSKLESLEIEKIDFNSSLTEANEKLTRLLKIINEHPTLQKFNCPLTTYLSASSSYMHHPFDYHQFYDAKLEANQIKRSTDLHNNLNTCFTILRGFFNSDSTLSKLPLDVVKIILSEYLSFDNFVWKTNEQKANFIECLTLGFIDHLNSSFVDKLKGKHVEILESNPFSENQFTFFLKPNVNDRKRANDNEDLSANKSSCLEKPLTL